MTSDANALAANPLTFRKAVQREATDTLSRDADLKENVGRPADGRLPRLEPTALAHSAR